jgi:hypothetical protein
MAVTSRQISTRTVTAQPVVRRTVSAAIAPIARRALPLVTASIGTALATLAAEQALGSLALRAVERTGLVRAQTAPTDDVTRVIVTHTTIVERITRRG